MSLPHTHGVGLMAVKRHENFGLPLVGHGESVYALLSLDSDPTTKSIVSFDRLKMAALGSRSLALSRLLYS